MLRAIAYATYYAMVDREDYLKVGVISSAILFGAHDRLVTALLQAGVLGALAFVGRALGPWYFAGLRILSSSGPSAVPLIPADRPKVRGSVALRCQAP